MAHDFYKMSDKEIVDAISEGPKNDTFLNTAVAEMQRRQIISINKFNRNSTIISYLLLFLTILSFFNQFFFTKTSIPSNLQECITEASKKNDASAMNFAKRICEESFGKEVIKYSAYSGSYYFIDGTKQCNAIFFNKKGIIDHENVWKQDEKMPFCEYGSKLELDDAGALTLACKNFNNGGITAIFSVLSVKENLNIKGLNVDRSATLFKNLSSCELFASKK